MNKWIIAISMVCCLLTGLPLTAAAKEVRESGPAAVQGTLDAAGWNFSGQGMIYLNGEWQFYWHALLEPNDFSAAGAVVPEPKLAKVPHVWGSGAPGDPAPDNLGYATYRLDLKLGEGDPGVKSIYIPAIATAYKLWVNGELAAEVGTVGTDPHTMKPKTVAKTVQFHPRPGANELVIQVSNYVQRKGGLWTPLMLGNSSDIMFQREKNIASQLVVAIGLLTLGAYHLGLFMLRKFDTLSLLIGLFCALLALRTLLLGDTLLVRFWPGLDWEVAVKLEYLAPYVGVPLFGWYVRKLYPQDANRRLINVSLAVGALFSLVVLLFPAIVYTRTMLAYQAFTVLLFSYLLYVFMLAVKRRREGALLNGAGTLIMFASVINDVLYYNHVISSVDFVPYGVFIFLFVQTMVVALKYTNAYYMVQNMSVELKDVNATLEDKIRERTEALELSNMQLREANEHLKEMEAVRKVILTNISHEIGTPMTAVQGYIKALLDGVIQPQDRKYISMIYDKVLMVNRLTQDLFDLSKLESGKAKFETCEVAAEDLFEQYFREFQYDVEKKNIRFEMEEISGLPADQLALLTIDPVRIQQVVGNIVYNATKFTAPGGLIRISGELMRAPGASLWELVVRISDTGIGIAPEAVPHIFDRFYKGSAPEHANSEGTGLGLAIAKEIITYHGGTIGVESVLRKGSTFHFTLPVELLPLEVE
ncbi:sensor histidine kinase [Paenibacillus hamazuiensis]|uniref:sensor histidine kinase n=1 Tax=Paenibacillus hamazuiensis TaxID=2936508 RepID=UPI00200D046B|nr:sensor histidine kinase [Paenibacillus hamazuiensis]